LKASADLVLSLDDVKAEAFRLRRGQTPRLGLREFGLRATAAEGPDAAPGGRPARAVPVGPPPTGRPPDGSPCTVGPSTVGAESVRPAETEPAVRPEVFQTSPSALKLLEQCPFRYRQVYVEGRPEPPNRWTFVGNAVHQALKDFFASRPSERSWKLLEESLRRAWRRQPGREKAFAGHDDEAEAGRQALADLKVFFEKCDRRAEPFALEVFLTTEVGEGVVVRGKVDRVDLLQPDDALVVIDYKTGRPPATPPSLIEEFQLPLYHAMVTEAYSRPVRRVVLYYLRGNVTFDFPLGEDDILRSKRRAFALARAIQAEKEFPPRVSALCRLCPTLGECPSREEVERRYAPSAEGARREEEDEGDLPF
ncbi:MAG: PD-(D/E)XK nuclease family protein, partial [Firmicutes bacterium]|nr:PD-(D/E)XK nuclease family protein [Bacillota bacterium]